MYFDGHRRRYGDPFRLWRAIQSHSTVNFATITPLIDVGQEPETSQAIDALVDIFGVVRWDDLRGVGLTDWEVVNLLGEFSDYLEALKKNIEPGSTSSGPTDSAFSNSPEPPNSTANS